MFERYSEQARQTIFFAVFEARSLGSPVIETEHLLLGVVRADLELVRRLAAESIDEETFRGPVLAESPTPETFPATRDFQLTNQCKRILAYAEEEAARLDDRHIRTGHLLLGLMREKDSKAEKMLRQTGADLKTMRTRMAQEAKTVEPIPGRSRVVAREEAPDLPPASDPAQEERDIDLGSYSEKARRVIFFGRFEASHFGRGTIDPEHLLLGMLRESRPVLDELMGSGVPWAEARTRIEEKLGRAHPLISTSVDMPLSEASKRVLSSTAEECNGLGGPPVGVGHLLLGLLREEGSFAAQLLRDCGADPEEIRTKLKSAR
jgi:ATP-dependent Clp protease ATP-binding subunit ClpA